MLQYIKINLRKTVHMLEEEGVNFKLSTESPDEKPEVEMVTEKCCKVALVLIFIQSDLPLKSPRARPG